MNGVFNAYAAYYDLLYKDKDYAGETNYIQQLLQHFAPNAIDILEMGCGTGGHAAQLASLNYHVTGVDMSHEMLARAETRVSTIVGEFRPQFVLSDLREYVSDQTFDVVLALFHVISYQTSNKDLIKAFSTAAKHLRPDGKLIFDFWYGPGVLNDPPTVRVRRMESEDVRVTRIAEPAIDINANLVDVKFDVRVEHAEQHIQLQENHLMRYLFAPELDMLLSMAGLKRVELYQWNTMQPPEQHTWYACIVATTK